MEKKRWVLVAVAIVTVASVAGALLYVLSLGLHSGPLCHISVDLSDPLRIDDQAWVIEVSDVTYGIPECRNDEVDQFGVVLEKGETEIIPMTELRNGLVGESNNTFVFFEDNDKIGRLDRGDIFYIVGVESSSEYEFSLIFAKNWEIVGHVSISTWSWLRTSDSGDSSAKGIHNDLMISLHPGIAVSVLFGTGGERELWGYVFEHICQVLS